MENLKARILFVCKDRMSAYGAYGYGASYGLINSCRFVGEALNRYFPGEFEFKVASVVDNNRIDAEVYKYKPTHVIIEALWVVPEKMNVLLPKYPNINWIVRIHSKA